MENHEDNLQQEIIDSLAKKVTNLEKRQDEMDKNDVTSISEKIKELEIKVSGISETKTLENTKLLERFEKQVNGFGEKINAIPKEIPINHKLQFNTKSKLVIRTLLLLIGIAAISVGIIIVLAFELSSRSDYKDKYKIVQGFYPRISEQIDSAYIVNGDTLLNQAEINIKYRAGLSNRETVVKRTNKNNEHAVRKNRGLKKYSSK